MIFDIIEAYAEAHPLISNPLIQLEVAAIIYFVTLKFYKRKYGG